MFLRQMDISMLFRIFHELSLKVKIAILTFTLLQIVSYKALFLSKR
jgi:hypothetical protein